MALKDANPWVLRGGAVAVAAGLYILGTYYPDVANDLKVLAGTVLGWIVLPRPGDSRPPADGLGDGY